MTKHKNMIIITVLPCKSDPISLEELWKGSDLSAIFILTDDFERRLVHIIIINWEIYK